MGGDTVLGRGGRLDEQTEFMHSVTGRDGISDRCRNAGLKKLDESGDVEVKIRVRIRYLLINETSMNA